MSIVFNMQINKKNFKKKMKSARMSGIHFLPSENMR